MPPPRRIEAPFDKLPEFAQQVRLWAIKQPKYYAEDDDYMPEISARTYEENQARKNPLGNLPLIVLTREKYDYPGPDAAVLVREHKDQQARMAGLSNRGQQIIVPNSGHEIHLYAPDIVVNAIREVSTTSTISTSDQTLLIPNTSTINLTLPDITTVPVGKTITVKRKAGGAGIVTLLKSGAAVEGAVSLTIDGTTLSTVTVQSDGVEWWVISKF
jgi:hypothetical protein